MAQLHAAIASTLTQGAVRDRLSADGAEVLANRPEEARRFLETELARWRAVVKAAGLKGE
jgi:tripartite-type tricarboxylate transporter receptor subunit TctC